MPRKTLATIPAVKLERFLRELANLKVDESNAISRFLARFEDMLADLPSSQEVYESPHPSGRLLYRSPRFEKEYRLQMLSVLVMSIWRGATRDQRQQRVLLLYRILSSGKPTFFVNRQVLKALPSPGPFEQAILHLLNSEDRVMVCGNPECPAPLFFRSRTNRRQRYCSTDCSGIGQRVAKRKWWTEHGQQWRENEQSKQKRKRGEKRGTRKAR